MSCLTGFKKDGLISLLGDIPGNFINRDSVGTIRDGLFKTPTHGSLGWFMDQVIDGQIALNVHTPTKKIDSVSGVDPETGRVLFWSPA